jgi:hypothetical protein
MSQPVITNTITNTVDIGHKCCGTVFNMNRLAIRVIQPPTSSHIVYLDPKGKLIDRVPIVGVYSTNISLCDDTIKCTYWKSNTIHCYTYGQCWYVVNTVDPTHHCWLRFLCSFYHQAREQQRCLSYYQPHKHSYVYLRLLWNRFQHESSSYSSNTATYIKSHCIFRS